MKHISKDGIRSKNNCKFSICLHFLQSRIHIKAAKKNIANPEENNTYVLV